MKIEEKKAEKNAELEITVNQEVSIKRKEKEKGVSIERIDDK